MKSVVYVSAIIDYPCVQKAYLLTITHHIEFNWISKTVKKPGDDI